MNPTSQILEILAANKKTVIVALIAAILVAIVILAIQAFNRKKPTAE
jgi:hypothetical protein